MNSLFILVCHTVYSHFARGICAVGDKYICVGRLNLFKTKVTFFIFE